MIFPRYSGLDSSSPEVLHTLRNIQATLLKGHGRKFGNLFFFIIGSSAPSVLSARHFLGNLPITTAATQIEQIRAFKLEPDNQESVITNVAISYEGFRKLAVPPTKIPRDVAFRDGMKFASSTRLKETNVATWQKEFRRSLHGVVLLASSSEAALLAASAVLESDLRTAVGLDGDAFSERCYVRYNPNGQVVEHFGFADGISQPLFFKSDIDAYVNEVGADVRYDPSADPFRLILVQEPTAVGGGYGSYLSFRKIAQNVVGFQDGIAGLAAQTGNSESVAAALVVGRHNNGRPLVGGDIAPPPLFEGDNFNYADDRLGKLCPLQSHVRKANPRLEDTADRRIARRGMSYGDGGGEQGLLFMAYQADLTRQFEFLQGRWANSIISSEDSTIECGVDALTGVYTEQGVRSHSWPSPWGDWERNIPVGFGGWTTVRGGEYFYAPSISFLRFIGN